MINNFDIILRDHLQFDEFTTDNFYMIEIIQRRKDSPNMLNGARTIKQYFVRDLVHLKLHAVEIVQLCEMFKARAYIRLNRRSFEQCYVKALFNIAKMSENKNFSNIQNMFSSVAGENHVELQKRWLVDADGDANVPEIIKVISKIQSDQTKPNLEPKILKTKNGKHIICSPFNIIKFRDASPEFMNVDIHKDANTILYSI